MIETGNIVVGWIMQLRDIIALLAVLFYTWHLQNKLVPLLLSDARERTDKEADRYQQTLHALEERHQKDHASIERLLEKLNDTLADGLQHLKDVLVEHYKRTEGFLPRKESAK